MYQYNNYNYNVHILYYYCYITGALENPIPIPLLSALEDRNMHILNNEQEGILYCKLIHNIFKLLNHFIF